MSASLFFARNGHQAISEPDRLRLPDGNFAMRRVCAWCKRELPPKPCPEKDHGETTHTICPDCLANALEVRP